MKLTKTILDRGIRALIMTMICVLGAIMSVSDARAQLPSGAEQLETIMKHRQEVSKQAVDETLRRRYEDNKKSESKFPLDGKVTKGGVVRALTPEERKALQHNERGLNFFSKGKLDAAMKEYAEAIRLDPTLAAAHNNLGSVHFAAGRFEEAGSAFRRACDLDPQNGQSFFNLALAQIKLGREKEATESLHVALRAYNSTGEAQLNDGRLKEAEETFRAMLQIDPEYAPALLRLGLVYIFVGRYQEAIPPIRRVLERESRNHFALELLAEALYGQHKYEEAAATAERALKLSPDFADAHYLAGVARASLGQRDAALGYVDRLRQLNAAFLAQKLANFINQKAPARQ